MLLCTLNPWMKSSTIQLTVGEIADLLGGTVRGERETLIKGASTIENGKEGTICFLSNLKYESYIYESDATAILVDETFEPAQPIKASLIFVPNVYQSLAVLLEKFNSVTETISRTISPHALIDSSASIGANTGVGHHTVIEAGVVIGAETDIGPQVFIGKNVSIGSHCILMAGVKIMHECKIGDHCIIHANTVIGSDGFGFAPTPTGEYIKIQQNGNVIVGDRVEIGSNCSIDRATFGSTIIHDGVKLDNLIQIAHNVEIGANTVIAAQTGIAGSAKVGESCIIGGQVGIAGHLTIAEGAKIQGQSGIQSSIKNKNTRLYGSPAIEYTSYLRSYAIFKRLPSLLEKLGVLEKSVLSKQTEVE